MLDPVGCLSRSALHPTWYPGRPLYKEGQSDSSVLWLWLGLATGKCQPAGEREDNQVGIFILSSGTTDCCVP